MQSYVNFSVKTVTILTQILTFKLVIEHEREISIGQTDEDTADDDGDEQDHADQGPQVHHEAGSRRKQLGNKSGRRGNINL